MAKHKISYWEVQVKDPSEELYIFGKKSAKVSSTPTTIEEEICSALRAAKSSYLPVGEILTEIRTPAFALLADDVTQLMSLEQFSYGTTRTKGTYLLSRVRYGRNNDFADAVDLKSNQTTSLQGMYQTRATRVLLVFPENSATAYAALETISGQNPRAALEAYFSERIFKNKSKVKMNKILDSNYLKTILESYQPREISFDVPKNSQIGSRKSTRINLSTGLSEGDRKNLLEELRSIDPMHPTRGAKIAKNIMWKMMGGKVTNEISDADESRNYKVQLFDKSSNSQLVLDLDDTTRDFDAPLNNEEVEHDDIFYRRAADILKYIG